MKLTKMAIKIKYVHNLPSEVMKSHSQESVQTIIVSKTVGKAFLKAKYGWESNYKSIHQSKATTRSSIPVVGRGSRQQICGLSRKILF